ncbi:MAG: glycosyltransferase family 2 protein [Candidatus Bathyarchaeota archaeon]|nr:MAG: glycosyltransferase family 2 protein [Candidatus Bathyarchaeota archaeon]
MGKTMKYATVTRARNEERLIEKTLKALKAQTISPSQIIVVDDGSSDRTGEIAAKYADTLIRLNDRGYSVAGKPELAEVCNEGFRRVKKDMDYVLMCDADHILQRDYFETIVKKMIMNPRVVVASGRAKGEPYFEDHPRGSGRVVDAGFWRKVNGLTYPVVWGWEDWICFKALQQGYETRSFPDVVTVLQRPTRLGKARLWGKAMYALGYDWKYALGRCVLTYLKDPKAGLNMLRGWLVHQGVDRCEFADWVNQMQKKQFWNRVRTIIRRGGRR